MTRTKSKGGRPEIEISVDQVARVAGMGLTLTQSAAVIGCSINTLQRRLKRPEYREVWERGPGQAQAKLMGLLWKAANNGNSRILALMAVNMLGWTSGQKLDQTINNSTQFVMESPGVMSPEQWAATYKAGLPPGNDDEPTNGPH